MMFQERLTKAQGSKNLGEVPVNEIGDVDLVRACGMAGVSNPLGLAIWRWRYAGDTREVFKIAEALVELGNEALVVYNVMHHLSKDVCPSCQGRGYGVVKGTPILSEDVCLDCHGVGRRELQGDAERKLAATISRLEHEIAAAIMKKLSREF
jgi:hypothetical protein